MHKGSDTLQNPVKISKSLKNPLISVILNTHVKGNYSNINTVLISYIATFYYSYHFLSNITLVW